MAGNRASQRGERAERQQVRPLRRLRAGFRFARSRFSVTPEEAAAQQERLEANRALIDDRQRAAEQLHWIIANEQVGRPVDAGRLACQRPGDPP